MPIERAIPTLRGRLEGTVTAPPSKSVTQRALIVAALAGGRSIVRNPLLADDSRHLINALGAVGIRTALAGAAEDPVVEVEGRGGTFPAASAEISVGNAGTAMRFLTAALAAGDGTYVIDGNARMRERPIEDLLAALRALGASASSVRGDRCPPVRVGGRGLRGGTTRLAGSKSSQYLSALLMASPLATEGTEIEIDGDLVSRPYVDLTIDVMERFGVTVRRAPPTPHPRLFSVAAGQRYGAREFVVEGDYSSASYFFAAAAVSGGRVTVEGLDPGSKQGDARLVDLLREMGCTIERGERSVTVEGTADLQGIDADLRAMPDVAQTLAVVALFARGPTRIRGVPHLRLKETDRISALVTEINRLGGEASAAEDGLTIRPRPLRGARIETYGDHRMAMAFAIAGLRVPGVAIRDPDCVAKSFPSFWSLLEAITSEAR